MQSNNLTLLNLIMCVSSYVTFNVTHDIRNVTEKTFSPQPGLSRSTGKDHCCQHFKAMKSCSLGGTGSLGITLGK